MYELVLLICLLADPEICKTRRPAFQTPMSLMDCLWQGQLQSARWAEQHPDWTIKRWRCSPLEA